MHFYLYTHYDTFNPLLEIPGFFTEFGGRRYIFYLSILFLRFSYSASTALGFRLFAMLSILFLRFPQHRREREEDVVTVAWAFNPLLEIQTFGESWCSPPL